MSGIGGGTGAGIFALHQAQSIVSSLAAGRRLRTPFYARKTEGMVKRWSRH